jgi:tetratricopeptide (TPR) repeat protein
MQLVDRDTFSIFIFLAIAKTFITARKFAEAMEYIQKAANINPNESIIYFMKGYLYFCFDDIAKLCLNFKKAAELGKGNYDKIRRFLQVIIKKDKHQCQLLKVASAYHSIGAE